MKQLKNVWRLILEKDEAEGLTCTAHYTVRCEHGLKEEKACPITFSSAQKEQAKQFLGSIVIPQIKTKENI